MTERVLVTSNEFTKLGVSREVATELQSQNIVTPTEIQRLAIPFLLDNASTRGRNVILAAETGSGKTVSFLAPLVDLVKQDEVTTGVETKLARPKALILTPTRELAYQISKVLKSLSRSVKVRAAVFGAKHKSTDSDALSKPMEIVVTTPSRAVNLRDEEKRLFFGSVKYLVVDEADTILGPKAGFLEDTEKLLKGMVGLQTKVFVGATLVSTDTRAAAEKAKKAYGRDLSSSYALKWIEREAKLANEHMDILRSTRLSKLPPGLQCGVFYSTEKNKHPALMSVYHSINVKIPRHEKRSRRILIFCNSVPSCRSTSHFLEMESKIQNGKFQVSCLHGDMPRNMRAASCRAFFKDLSNASYVEEDPQVDKLLVCTDIMARGLDFSREIDHVILFDLPSSISDFIHRIGRTARGEDASGFVTLIVGDSKKEKILSSTLMRAVHHNKDAHAPVASASEKGTTTDPSKLIIQNHRFKQPQKNLISKHNRLRQKSQMNQRRSS